MNTVYDILADIGLGSDDIDERQNESEEEVDFIIRDEAIINIQEMLMEDSYYRKRIIKMTIDHIELVVRICQGEVKEWIRIHFQKEDDIVVGMADIIGISYYSETGEYFEVPSIEMYESLQELQRG